MVVAGTRYTYTKKDYPQYEEKYADLVVDGEFTFQQLFQHLPFLLPFYTKFEADYDVAFGYDIVSNHWEGT